MQRQAMGVALHIVLLPFFELLHSTIDSYDADFVESAFFLRSPDQLLRLLRHPTVFRPLSLRVRPYYSPGGLYALRFRADSPVYPHLTRAERSGSFTRPTTASAAAAAARSAA